MLQEEEELQIQHMHYDDTLKNTTGTEHIVIGWKNKTVDGYFIDPDGSKVAIEFLGNHYHGHPSLWGVDGEAESFFHIPFKTLFSETEAKLQKLVDFGYTVLYVWECDFKKRPAFASAKSLCRKFSGKLEFE